MHISHKKNVGFTLIEMLLVIAVLAVLISIGIMTYRDHAISTRINKASLQIQSTLEAAMAFNVDHSKWPTANAGLPTCEPADPANNQFIKDYMPNSQIKSVYGTNICWSAVSSSNGQESRLFWVALQVANNNANVARRLAAQLPNAVVTAEPQVQEVQACSTDQPCFVRAEIPVPGQTSNTSKGLSLAAQGTCQTGRTINSGTGVCSDISRNHDEQKYQVSFKACPANESPHIMPSPNYLYIPPGSQGGTALTKFQAVQVGTCSTTADASGNEHCTIEVNADYCKPHKTKCQQRNIRQKSGAREGASYFVVCQPTNALKRRSSFFKRYL